MRKFLAACIPLLVAILVVGCGASTTAQPGAATPKNTPTATATVPPTPVATHGVVTSGHPCGDDPGGQVSYVRIGDLKVSEAHFMLAYPARQLPATLDTSRPYKLPANAYDPPSPPVNPHVKGGSGYGFVVCNTSAKTSHVIAGVTVGISVFTPHTGKLNVWQFCDPVYARPDGLGGGGCGGAYQYDEALQASFAANATTGAQVTATHVTGDYPDASDLPPLPIALGPGQMIVLSLGITPPTAPGTYTFAFGLNYDTVTAAPISSMEPTLFDSAAIKWSGETCTKPALLSQIPTTVTTPPINYVCAP